MDDFPRIRRGWGGREFGDVETENARAERELFVRRRFAHQHYDDGGDGDASAHSLFVHFLVCMHSGYGQKR